jgi:peptidoglycan L-alanyl-D-glutamate endopeptidase CwlK
LQHLFTKIADYWDVTIICGHRTLEEQKKAHSDGASQLIWPNSKHNGTPSLAIDAAPYCKQTRAISNDREQIHMFVGYVIATAKSMDINLRSGADWNMNNETSDNEFDDLMHFELIEE